MSRKKENKQKYKNIKNNKFFSWEIVNKFIIFTIIFCGVFYIIAINDLSIKGFVLEELKNEKIALVNENQSLELNVMELESYENIIGRAEGLKMVKVDKIDYITIIDGAVAVK